MIEAHLLCLFITLDVSFTVRVQQILEKCVCLGVDVMFDESLPGHFLAVLIADEIRIREAPLLVLGKQKGVILAHNRGRVRDNHGSNDF